jgi:hypothetical protein
MLNGLMEKAGAGALIALFLLGQFPGGTIFMAMMCRSRRLDGWDWVLSVVIPFYGLFKGAFSSC